MGARQTLERHDVWVAGDRTWQRPLRLGQALWRTAQGLPVGLHRGRPLGSRLERAHAEATGANLLHDAGRAAVRAAIADAPRTGALIGQPRVWVDLLSSQPLCFNLFAPLQADLDQATVTLRRLLPDRVGRVTQVRFEWSPGRSDPRFTGDKSAFDVVFFVDTPTGGAGVVGVEVKLHEPLTDPPAAHRARYDHLADAMGIFAPATRAALRQRPLQQLHRDHLLAGSLVQAGVVREATFVVLAPRANLAVQPATAAYRATLLDDARFVTWDLAQVLDALEGAGPWVAAARDRYQGRVAEAEAMLR